MTENPQDIAIPKRALFRGAEVCELLNVQPYVLRTWESEFPALGIVKTAGGPRVYRRADVEQVMRIKHLLLVEGLTLAGARRRLEDEAAPIGVDASLDELMGRNARDRLTEIKRSLRAILDLLATGPNGERGGARPPAVLSMRPITRDRQAATRTPAQLRRSRSGSPASAAILARNSASGRFRLAWSGSTFAGSLASLPKPINPTTFSAAS